MNNKYDISRLADFLAEETTIDRDEIKHLLEIYFKFIPTYNKWDSTIYLRTQNWLMWLWIHPIWMDDMTSAIAYLKTLARNLLRLDEKKDPI